MTSKILLRISLVSAYLAMFAFALNTPVISAASDDSGELISASDLTRDARLVGMGERILMIEFSSEYCGYCRLLENEFLKPMAGNAGYSEKVVIRYISLSDDDNLLDFNGKSISASEFASRYDVFVTPTLVFLNDRGEEVSDKLVGIWSVDFFGGFIDERIDSGLASQL
jgi:thioredoxin-related protein